jgi:hypothetical protein
VTSKAQQAGRLRNCWVRHVLSCQASAVSASVRLSVMVLRLSPRVRVRCTPPLNTLTVMREGGKARSVRNNDLTTSSASKFRKHSCWPESAVARQGVMVKEPAGREDKAERTGW